MQGASAIQNLLNEQRDPGIRVFVIWEPILPTDLAAPSTRTLARISDSRAAQYWDHDHLLSRAIGESDGVVWDYVAVYDTGKRWDQAVPEPVYSRVPVVRSIEGTREAMNKVLSANTNK